MNQPLVCEAPALDDNLGGLPSKYSKTISKNEELIPFINF
jgi:hypothetical protein